MIPQPQSERETWRAIVLNCEGAAVLLQRSEHGFFFPSLEIPRWERLAENLTAGLKREWGCDAVCLFTASDSCQGAGPNDNHYEVMQCWRDQECTSDAVWKPLHALTAASFQDGAAFRTLRRCLQELDGYEHDRSSPFAGRGWFNRVRGWAADVIRPFELELGPSFRQYNASATFSLIRFETNGPAVWFKAAGEPNRREFPVTVRLAELFPRFVPEILGTRPEWNTWLSREIKGTNLGETKEATSWKKAATGLAELQIESIAGADSIVASGAHDLRTGKLLDSLDPFFEAVARLMEEQPGVSPPALSREDLSLLKLRIEDALTLLEDLQIPTTLGHLDLNPWNIIVSADGCVFLDWAEAYIGHPFFSLEYLLQHFRREAVTGTALESELINAYKVPWRPLSPDDPTSQALALTPLLAVFGYAAGTQAWKDEERRRDPRTAAYLRSLARKMNREAIQFSERRAACLV